MFTQMVDMARTPEEAQEASEMPQAPIYPYGLSICLCDDELDKLGMEANCDVGDMIHLVAMAKVTSVSKSDGGCRVELQITHLGTENEDEEDESPQPSFNKMRGKMYTGG